MSLEMVLNELSCVPAPDIPTARQRMTLLIGMLQAAVRCGVRRQLRTCSEPAHVLLANDYPIWRWQSDEAVEREERTWFRSVATQCPLQAGLDGQAVNDQILRCEHRCNGATASGLGMAHLLEGLGVSFHCDPYWRYPRITVEQTLINDDLTLETMPVDVRHGCEEAHVRSNIDWIRTRLADAVEDGEQLWRERTRRFPGLVFAGRSERQLRDMNGGETHFVQVYRHLFVLSTCFASWDGGAWNLDGVKWSPESQQTLDHATYGPMRVFVCSDGIERKFTYHTKLIGANVRIYFRPHGPRRAEVVYIGKHIPSVEHPTV